MCVLKKQIGGNHYKKLNYQPAELFAKLNCNAFQANIIKYTVRGSVRRSIVDYKKCKHYAELAQALLVDRGSILEKNNSSVYDYYIIKRFCLANTIPEVGCKIIDYAMSHNYDLVIDVCNDLLQWPKWAIEERIKRKI